MPTSFFLVIHIGLGIGAVLIETSKSELWRWYEEWRMSSSCVLKINGYMHEKL